MMSNILNSLSKMLDDKHDNWDRFLPFVQYSYNTTPCLDSTGYSPYFLNHGRYPRMPLDTVLRHPADVAPSVGQFIERTVKDLEFAHVTAETILTERKAAMQTKSEHSAYNPKFKVGDIVYIYEPVIVPGNTKKLSRPFAGPYFIFEKPSELHARLRRVSDGKIIKNKVHINRLKLGLLRSDQPIDLTPPIDADATEPVVLSDNELALHNVADHDSRPNDGPTFSVAQPKHAAKQHLRKAQAGTPVADTSQAAQNTQQSPMFTVEKVLRKKYMANSWYYRIKWLSFSNDYNSWVPFTDLSPPLQLMVSNTKIPIDRKSQRKK